MKFGFTANTVPSGRRIALRRAWRIEVWLPSLAETRPLLAICVRHERVRWKNNRAEKSRRPTRRRERWECQEFCVRGRFSHHALTHLSSNMMANWVLASHHSRGGIFHVCATWRKTRYSNLIAASSFGKWPLVRTARRNLAFKDSMAFITGMRALAPKSGCERHACGVWCDHPGQRRREHEGAGRPIYSMS
jgi:hypothetical protein